MDSKEVLLKLLEAFEESNKEKQSLNINSSIPLGISNRHVHLSSEDLDVLFGEGYELNKMKDLSQPGQYACKETITICGPKGAIENVRVLGPTRNKTQVEVLASDGFKLGLKPPVKLSGDLEGTNSVTLVGKKGSVNIKEGLIVAQRHIHMSKEDLNNLGLIDGQMVSIEIEGLRGGIYNNVAIRATENSSLECHLDIEEANSMGVNALSKVKIKK